jgi:hypothetical protein
VNRRALLRQAGATALLPLLGACAPSPRSTAPPFRRVRPSDPAWPSASAWDALNRHVGGALIPVRSPLVECAASRESATCAEFVTHVKNPYYLGDHVGLTQNFGWVDAWTSRPSVYAVAARSAADVAAAVIFAREHRLRVVV